MLYRLHRQSHLYISWNLYYFVIDQGQEVLNKPKHTRGHVYKHRSKAHPCRFIVTSMLYPKDFDTNLTNHTLLKGLLAWLHSNQDDRPLPSNVPYLLCMHSIPR